MSLIGKVTSKGQTTLPVELRKELGIKPGDRVRYVRQADGRYSIERQSDSIMDLRGIIKLGRPVSTEEILRWVDEARDAAISDDDDRT